MSNTEEEKSKKKKGLIFIIIGAVIAVAAVATVLALTLGGGSSEGGSQETTQNMSEAERTLHELLAADGSAVVELTEDVVLTQPLMINGDKTIKGNFTLTSTEGMEYAITVMDGAALSYDGPTLDLTAGATNGIYVSAAGKLNVLSGNLANAAGHGIRNLGTTVVKGGNIENIGTNWIMVDENAALEISGGQFKKAGEVGIITGAGSKLTITDKPSFDETGSYTVYASGDSVVNGGTYSNNGGYTFYNGGKMSLENLTFSGAKYLGYIENGPDSTMTVKNTEFKDTGADYVYNQGNLTIENSNFGDSINSAIESKGKNSILTVKDCTLGKIGQSVFLIKAGEANLENITAESAGTHFISNRSGRVTGKNLKVGDCGGGALMNEALSDNDLCGSSDVDGFECGNCGTYGIRCDGGTISVKNATIGKSTSYCLYLKEGSGVFENVDFTGMSVEGRATVMVGYGAYRTAVGNFTNCTFTGGARGFTNHANSTLTDCEIYGNASSGTIHVGGGINNDGTLVVDGCKIHDNKAVSSGGGIYNKGTITIKSGTKIYNNRSATSGGGFANSKGTAVVEGGQFYDNYASNYGGGIYNSGSMKFQGGTVSGNNCAKGGGGMENTGKVTLSGGTIKNNRTDSFGGGFYNGKAGTATLCGVTIKNNRNGKEKSGGGIYNLGTCYIKSGTKITGNVADTYGGGVTNGLPSDGSAMPKMYISGGVISDNTAATKGGGGVYNRAQMTISGGTISGNHTSDGQNGQNVYTSGTLNLKGGTIKDNTGKPYDVYAYKGEVNLSGSFNIGSMYKAADSTVNITGNFTTPFNYYMTTYNLGDYVAHGSKNLIINNRDKFILPADKVADNLFINDDGRLDDGASDLNKVEAELIRDGKVAAKGLFTAICAQYESGDTIQIDEDVTIKDAIALSFVSKTASNAGKSKSVTITDNGKPHTVTIASPNNAGFYIAANGGDGADGPSDSGYYRTYMTVSIVGKGGLTFAGIPDEQMKSAFFYVTSNATFNVSGKVTFKDAYNVGTEASVAADHTAGKYGGAIYVTNSTLNIDGAAFENCHNDNSGGAIYLASKGTINVKNTTFTGCSAGANGGAVYIYQNGNNNVLTNCTFTNNTATGNGNAIGLSSNDSTSSKVTLSGVTVKNDSEAGYDVYLSDTSVFALSGKSVISEIYAQNVIKLNSVSDGSSIGVAVPSEDYMPGTRVYSGSADVLKKAAAVSALAEKAGAETVLCIGEDGTLVKYINKGAELYNGSGALVTTTTFEEAVAAAQDGYTIKLTEDAVLEDGAEITVEKNITIDGMGNTVKLGTENTFATAAGTEVTLKDITIPEVSAEGTIIPAGTVDINKLSLAEGVTIKASQNVSSDSALGVTVPDALFVEGTQVVTPDAAAEDTAMASVVAAVTMKNVSANDLKVGDDGKLKVNTNANAILIPLSGDEEEGKFVDLLTMAQPGDTIKLIDDFNVSTDIEITQDLTIIGEDKTITFVADNTGLIVKSGTLTVAGNFNVAGTVTSVGEGAEKIVTAGVKVAGDASVVSAEVASADEPPVITTPYYITAKGYGQSASGMGTYTAEVIRLDQAAVQVQEIQFANFDEGFASSALYVDAVNIKVLADCESAGGLYTGNAGNEAGGDATVFTLDMNGKTLTVLGDQFIKLATTFNLVDMSEEKGGKIIGTNTSIASSGFIYNNGTKEDNYSKHTGYSFTVDGVSIESAGTYTLNASGYLASNIILKSGEVKNTEAKNAIRVNTSQMIISGGNVYGSLVLTDSAKGAVSISGGSFSIDPDHSYLISGFTTEFNTSTNMYDVVEQAGADKTVKIGTKSYATITAALADAAKGDTITLIKDIEGPVTVDSGKEVTIDLNGHKITGTGSNPAITNAGTLTVKNGTIDRVSGTSVSTGGAILNDSTGVLTVEGLTVENCKAVNGAGIYNKSGKVTVNSATFRNCQATSSSGGGGALNNNGSNTAQMIINDVVVESTNTANNGPGVYSRYGLVTINGGKFAAAVKTSSSDGKIEITGGYFTSDVSAYCKPGYSCVPDTTYADYGYTIISNTKPIAQVGDVTYTSLEEAVAAALELQTATITLVDDVTLENRIELRKSSTDTTVYTITLNLNGKNITDKSTKGLFLVAANGKVTITGSGVITLDDGATNTYIAYVNASGILCVEGGTFNGFTSAKSGNGSAIFAGGTFEFDPSANCQPGYVANNNGDGTWTVTEEN